MTGPLPLVVSVTGHVDIGPEDAAALTERVRAFLAELGAAYPHTPIELLTPLAEGADRIAAHAALSLDIPIIAVLPLEIADYKKDFAGDASIRDFDDLLARAAHVIVLPQGDQALARPDCYARVGAFGVRHAHVLLALWDGIETGKTGGTSEIVRFSREGVPRHHARSTRLLNPADTGVVYHIVAPRTSAPRPPAAFTGRWLAPHGGGEVEARGLLAEIAGSTDEFNAHALEPGSADAAGRSERDLTSGRVKAGSALAPLTRLYGFADALAIRFQTNSRRAILALFVLVWLSIVAFETFTDLDIAVAVIPFVLLFGIAYAVYLWMKSRGIDARYLDYRSLAEALRVQFYWRAAGITDSVAAHYMRYRIRESEWIRKALLALELRLPPQAGESAVAEVTADWVEAQNAFFVKNERRDDALHHKLDSRALVLMIVSTILLLGPIVLSIPDAMETLGLGTPAWLDKIAGAMTGLLRSIRVVDAEGDYHGLVVLIGVLAAAAGAFHGYGEKRALDAQAKRYARMHTVFQSALDQLKAPEATGAQATAILRELGREALEENADWVMLHRERPLEPPGPGH